MFKVSVNFHPRHSQKDFLLAFRRGLERHNVRLSKYDADLYVFWGARRAATMTALDRDWICLEHGFFGDRINKFCSISLNGVHGMSEKVTPENSPADRWLKHGVLIADWQDNPDGYVLLCQQVPNDASLVGMPENWYEDITKEAEQVFGRPVKIRPHPAKGQPPTGLKEDLAGAFCNISWSSNTGVDGLIAGVPTFAYGPCSMVKGFNDLNKGLQYPDRSQWLNDLAYRQWTQEELAHGDCWDMLRGLVEC